ncbi:MAG: hypothetical protein G3M70_10410 [Candidatus Nitronauta litoralis]|uniref:Uncharacterized protein n=1 Tax=Candidatus Nitronauta litoralis TaxID=2705533 RepID=A0A7T0BWJ0_9BACT|nr:MAG: hypothetical protein G3M70_10410 [Candidatus Nitronauta litoralis]
MSENNNGQTPWAISFLLVFSGIIAFQTSSPLKASRPSNNFEIKNNYSQLEEIDSRLWEDPFAAIERLKKRNKDDLKVLASEKFLITETGDHEIEVNATLKETAKDFFYKTDEMLRVKLLNGTIFDDNFDRLLVLGVLFPEGKYFEDTETRRRRRYAILSAMGEEGYTPNNPKKIGILPYKTNNNTRSELIPFEGLKKGNDQVLIFWLNESFFNSIKFPDSAEPKPLRSIIDFMDFLANDPENTKVVFKIIGPTSSDSLKNILKELTQIEKNFPKGKIKHPRKLEIISPNTTADETELLKTINSKENSIASLFEKGANDISFIKATPSDKELARAVWDELALRCISNLDMNCDQEKYNVAYISEWDTFYGRKLPEAFKITKAEKGFNGEDIVYHYMRGLDGKTQNPSSPEAKKETSNSEKETLINLGQLEKAEGNNQYDYLRRIGQNLKKRDKELFQKKREKINAIGVLGSDIYDKLLVLEALKKDFPKAVFFTTDLDYIFLHKDHFTWTRNLIVSSGYDFQLNKKWQQVAPPFRSSYQTANFLATLIALDNFEKTPAMPGKTANWIELIRSSGPLVYEIGRTKAFRLDKNNINETLHPEKTPFLQNKDSWFFIFPIGSILLAALIFYLIFPDWRKGFKRWSPKIAVIFIALILIIYFDTVSSTGEIFSFSHGVSIWPTEIIRVLAIFIAILLFLNARKTIRESSDNLKTYFLTEDKNLNKNSHRFKMVTGFPGGPSKLWRFIKSPKKFLRAYEWSLIPKKPKNGCINPVSFWKLFRLLDSFGFRMYRTCVLSILFTAFGILMARQWPPYIPYRGVFNLTFDWIILYCLLIPSFLILVFFVVDATSLCSRFLHELRSRPTGWKKHTLEKLLSHKIENDTHIQYYRDWADIKIVAKQSETIQKIIIYPFYIEFLVIVSRSTLFDRWDAPISLSIIFFLCAAFPIFFAYRLQIDAKKIKEKCLENLSQNIIKLKEQNFPESRKIIRQLKKFATEIETINEGTFRPFSQQPVIRNLLVPFSGYGGLALYEYIMLSTS